jgi:hypothetical protein
MPATQSKNHSPTIRLLGSQVATALSACGELRADLRSLDDEVEQVRLSLAKMPASTEEYQALQVEVARLKERMSIIVGILAVLQIIGTAIAAYLAGR